MSVSTADRTSEPPAEHFAHLRRDRQLDAEPVAERERGAGRLDAFGDHLHAGDDVVQPAAARQLGADVAVPAEGAGARQHQIAQAAQSGQRIAASARGARQPRDLREPAGDERGQGVVPEAQPFDDARGDGDDVLHRAADLHADDIVAAVQAGRTGRGTRPARARSLRRRPMPRGRRSAAAARPPCAKLGPDSTTTGWPGPLLRR